jgi:thiamine-phosphate pyrophosphorylase
MERREAAERLRHARLYAILDLAASPLVRPMLEGGVDLVQLRDKEASDEELVSAGTELGRLCAGYDALFVMNDRPDLALECRADGVHVGQDDAPVEAVRELAGDRLVVGVSTHSPEQVDAAERSDADYFAVGPVHATPTKPGRPAVGLELVRYAAEHARKPWFAIGGVHTGNAREVVGAGAERLAVVRALCVDDPLPVAREMRATAEGAVRHG